LRLKQKGNPFWIAFFIFHAESTVISCFQ